MIYWTDDLCEGLLTRFKAGNTYAVLAGEMEREYHEQVHPDRLRSALRRYIARRDEVDTDEVDERFVEEAPQFAGFLNALAGDVVEARFPEPSRITEIEVLTLHDPNVLIIGDIHAPFHSPEMLSRAVDICHKHFPHIRNCMVIGDVFDFSAISSHLNNQPTTSTETDMRAGGAIVRKLRTEFDHLYICAGNHDLRLSNKLNSEFSLTSLLCGALGNTDQGLHITDLDYILIGDEIIAGHPTMFSSSPTKIASKITLRQRKNIITGHSHKIGLVTSDDGEHWSLDNGHCASEELFYYAKRRLNTFGKSGAGFSIISNGRPFVFGENLTDWGFWL